MHKAPRSFTLGDVFAALWRNWLVVLIFTVLGGAGGYVVAQNLPDSYDATAKLISDASRSGLITVDDQTTDESGDATATSTIVESISTPVVLNHALDEMSPDLQNRLAEAAADPEDPWESDAERRQAMLRSISKSLEVSNSGRSFIVNLRYNATDPELAAGAANAVARGYLDYRQEMRNEVYGQMMENLEGQITELTNRLESAEKIAQTMRERARLLGQRSDVWVEGQQEEAIAENAALYARQREAEREVAATAVVYERLLLEHRQIQSRMGEPEINVQLFSPAVVPTGPSGFNVKPVLLLLGLFAGFLVGLSVAMLRERLRNRG